MKNGFHPRNPHRNRYDFEALVKSCPELVAFVRTVGKSAEPTIDFANPEAVLTLNKALLQHFYGIKNWHIPSNFLCPPIPGRADYIHHLADLLASDLPKSQKFHAFGPQNTILDIGVGANCVYPLIGHAAYNWRFVGSDIDADSIRAGRRTLRANPSFHDAIHLRLQKNKASIFKGVMHRDEYFAATICNPPYHDSAEDMEKQTRRKWKNLGKFDKKPDDRNFGGTSNELWYEGGEKAFVEQMIKESPQFARQVGWFTCILSKKSNLARTYKLLENIGAKDVRTIEMSPGQKTTRFVAWRFSR